MLWADSSLTQSLGDKKLNRKMACAAAQPKWWTKKKKKLYEWTVTCVLLHQSIEIKIASYLKVYKEGIICITFCFHQNSFLKF